MAKDPAWLFYPADASDDTQFLNRLERGCYFDLLKAQKKFSRFTIDIIKKVLGKDFDTCWASIEPVLAKDAGGYFIEWVDNSIERRKEFSKIQSERITNYHNKKKKGVENVTVVEPANNHGSTDEQPIVIENEIENINEKGNEDEKGVQGEKQIALISISQNKTKALTDENFVATFYRIGLAPPILPEWLDAFERWLLFTCEPIKTERDYRVHFKNWIQKIPYSTMKAANYNPAGDKNNQHGTTGTTKQGATGVIPDGKEYIPF